MTFDLIDKQIKDFYINTFKWMFIVSLILVPIIFGLCFVSSYLIIALIVDIIVSIVSLVFFIKNKRIYNQKIQVLAYEFNLLDNGKIKGTLKRNNLQYGFVRVGFFFPFRFVYKKCLVIYQNIEIYKEMKYRDYVEKSNLIIIQNTKTINEIFKLIVNK
ncbi:MAG: hypothetical protein SOU07_00035 [Bacilli bacterium]|nr:hypothetical protein [Acholeplasmataceae bacterium]MDY2901820.1 hypothetical protein [Bacilli bacterium]